MTKTPKQQLYELEVRWVESAEKCEKSASETELTRDPHHHTRTIAKAEALRSCARELGLLSMELPLEEKAKIEERALRTLLGEFELLKASHNQLGRALVKRGESLVAFGKGVGCLPKFGPTHGEKLALKALGETRKWDEPATHASGLVVRRVHDGTLVLHGDQECTAYVSVHGFEPEQCVEKFLDGTPLEDVESAMSQTANVLLSNESTVEYGWRVGGDDD